MIVKPHLSNRTYSHQTGNDSAPKNSSNTVIQFAIRKGDCGNENIKRRNLLTYIFLSVFLDENVTRAIGLEIIAFSPKAGDL